MQIKTVFAYDDYRKYLQGRLKGRLRGGGERGSITRLAEAAQCQRSHLSRVMSGQLHLTMDQAFRLTQFWQLSDEEESHFLKMVELERSGDPHYRSKLQRELTQQKKAHEDLSLRFKQPSLGSTTQEIVYYSTWYWSAIHILVSIPEFQTISAVSRRLALPEILVAQCLRTLESFGLVQNFHGQWKITSQSIHLSKQSPLNPVQHSNWRARAVLRSQIPDNDGIHYTIVQSVSKVDFERIRQIVLEAIDRYSETASPSKEEELICFACDLFRV